MRSALQVLSDDIGMNDRVRTTRIVAEELPLDRLTAEPWAVEWSNKLGDFRHVHHSKIAARRHVTNLLKTSNRIRTRTTC